MPYVKMSPEQRRHLEEVRETAAAFRPLARAREDFAGGMQWKTVKGHGYLTRYRQDPVTGEKRFTSLGRRSPETERMHNRFMTGRTEYEERLAALKPRMDLQARMAKALRLARAPAVVADVMRAVSASDLVEHLILVGDAALYAYECECGVLWPNTLLPSSGISFLVHGFDVSEASDEIATVLRSAGIKARPSRHGPGLTIDDEIVIDVITHGMLERQAEKLSAENAEAAQALTWAIEQDTVTTFVIDRDGRTAPVAVPDLRSFAIMKFAALETSRDLSVNARTLAEEMAVTAAEVVRDVWPSQFEERHVTAFAPLAAVFGHAGRRSPRM